MVKLWSERLVDATGMWKRRDGPQQSDPTSPALTTPKMPIPEPMVVMVGMMSNLPAWWWRPGREGLTVRRGLVGKAFLRSPNARLGVRRHPTPLSAGPTACCPGSVSTC